MNSIEGLVQVENKAVGATNGEVRFTKGMDTVNHIATDREQDVQVVPMVRLDSIAAAKQAIMAKLDVEGFEAKVLSGASDIFADAQLRIVETESRDTDVLDHLCKAGFERVIYTPFSRTISRFDVDEEDTASNALFVRDLAFVQARVREAPSRTIFGVSV